MYDVCALGELLIDFTPIMQYTRAAHYKTLCAIRSEIVLKTFDIIVDTG
jgi:hypothetical protein